MRVPALTALITLALGVLAVVSASLGVRSAGAEPKAKAWGTQHPCVLDAADPAGAWIVLCQARKDTDGDGEISVLMGHHGDMLGDAMVPYVIRGGGAGEAVDTYVTHSTDGRYLVVIKEDRLLLLDMRAGTRTDLSKTGASTADGNSAFGRHRAARFDRAGRRLLTIRDGKERSTIVVRELATGKVTIVDPGPGVLCSATLDETGHWVLLRVVAKDTDGNGTLECPTVHTTLAARGCRGSPRSYSSFGGGGDATVTRVAPATGGTAVVIPGLIAAIGAALLRRDAREALLLRTPDGKETEVVPQEARAVLYTRFPEQGAFLAAHRGPRPRAGGPTKSAHPLWIHVGKKSAPAGMTRRIGRDDPDDTAYGTWLRAFHNPTHSKFIHLPSLREVRFDGGTITFHGDRVLFNHQGKRAVRDLVTGRVWPLASQVTTSYPRRLQGSMYTNRHEVVDLQSPAVLGSYVGDALALALSGRVLVAARTHWDLAYGPLRWVQPKPR